MRPTKENVPNNTSHAFYRGDIDGLRAVAVCLVIADHIGFNHFDGGFIGVDVFFVISGYLISSILLRELTEGRFSITVFYERRMKRILPALFVVLIVTSILAWHYLFPVDLLDYARSLIATIFSASNFYFWQQSSYFNVLSTRRPLLHAWSLAVEEQFYLVFPLFLFWVHQFARKYLGLITLGLGVVSFLLSVYLVFRFPTAAFYLAPSRSWELLIGTYLALGYPKLSEKKAMRQAASFLGLLLIAAGAILIKPSSAFPGAWALLPCIGTALLILSGEKRDSIGYYLLSFEPIAFIGTISYSLYLWHWPLLAMRTHGFKESFLLDPHKARRVVLLETFLLGAASWWMIETPCRTRIRMSRRTTFAASGAISLVIVLWGGAVLMKKGFPTRWDSRTLQLASFVRYGGDQALYREGQCFLTTSVQTLDASVCLRQTPGQATYLLAGSSHAAHLWVGLHEVFPDINFQQATSSQCKPLLDPAPESSATCRQLNAFIFRDYLPTHRVDAVLLAASFGQGDLSGLGRTVDYLTSLGTRAVVIGPIMSYDLPLPELLARSERNGTLRSLPDHLDPYVFLMNAQLASLVGQHHAARYISLTDLLCPQQICVVFAKPLVPLQADQNHLTREGSVLVADRLRESGAWRRIGSP